MLSRTETFLLITFQYGLSIRHPKERGVGRARAGGKPFLLFLSPNSHSLGKFDTLAILCMMCTNLEPRSCRATVTTVWPCKDWVRDWVQPFDFNCNVVNTPLDEL